MCTTCSLTVVPVCMLGGGGVEEVGGIPVWGDDSGGGPAGVVVLSWGGGGGMRVVVVLSRGLGGGGPVQGGVAVLYRGLTSDYYPPPHCDHVTYQMMDLVSHLPPLELDRQMPVKT